MATTMVFFRNRTWCFSATATFYVHRNWMAFFCNRTVFFRNCTKCLCNRIVTSRNRVEFPGNRALEHCLIGHPLRCFFGNRVVKNSRFVALLSGNGQKYRALALQRTLLPVWVPTGLTFCVVFRSGLEGGVGAARDVSRFWARPWQTRRKTSGFCQRVLEGWLGWRAFASLVACVPRRWELEHLWYPD